MCRWEATVGLVVWWVCVLMGGYGRPGGLVCMRVDGRQR